ncbi:WYL domain-containing protein [Flavobacterium psychrophilum]|uniref:WYL domain-containing protein n=1 Tax=Flavobacterium psychrophilum TaxID=96345 RepID=UPI001D078146|nr:WYL domain-containing protein [Flavobacterium psychrophilum]MCB6089467.1 WYL domain-containing protein [Flavobacterium psychrophilum]
MNDKMKSCLILLENLLFETKKYSRNSLKHKLKEEKLSFSDSAITRILRTISDDFGIFIKIQNEVYQIIEDESEPNYLEKYNNLKSLLFREIIKKNLIENSIISQFISFGNNSMNKGIENIEIILNAILEKKKLKIHYQKFSDYEIKEHILEPIFIREFQNRWYVVSQTDEKEKFFAFAFDRIQKLEVLKKTFTTKNNNINFYKNTIGISYTKNIERIVLKFDNWQANYIKTLPLHSTQEIIREDENGLVISINVNINFELEQLIKSYGSSIEVIEPKELRENIKQDLQVTLKFYEN